VALGPAGTQREYGVQAIERLNRRLFIHTKKHGRVLRRIQYSPLTSAALGSKLRIVADPVSFQP
jgi:hypothetical protein